MGCSPWGREESDITEREHTHTRSNLEEIGAVITLVNDPPVHGCAALPVFHHRPLRTMIFLLNYVRGGQSFK